MIPQKKLSNSIWFDYLLLTIVGGCLLFQIFSAKSLVALIDTNKGHIISNKEMILQLEALIALEENHNRIHNGNSEVGVIPFNGDTVTK